MGTRLGTGINRCMWIGQALVSRESGVKVTGHEDYLMSAVVLVMAMTLMLRRVTRMKMGMMFLATAEATFVPWTLFWNQPPCMGWKERGVGRACEASISQNSNLHTCVEQAL